MLDGVFNFLDTYEERSLKLKVAEQEAMEEIRKLEKSLTEVRHQFVVFFLCVYNSAIPTTLHVMVMVAINKRLSMLQTQ